MRFKIIIIVTNKEKDKALNKTKQLWIRYLNLMNYKFHDFPKNQNKLKLKAVSGRK